MIFGNHSIKSSFVNGNLLKDFGTVNSFFSDTLLEDICNFPKAKGILVFFMVVHSYKIM